MMRKKIDIVLSLIISCIAISAAAFGLFYSNAGETFWVKNIYGQQVELYGNGIYAYNSLMTVSGRFGADWIGIVSGIFMILLSLLDERKIWVCTLRLAQSFSFIYYFASLTFSVSMNTLYLLYVSGFGLSIFTSMVLWNRYTNIVKVKADTKNSRNIGVSLCLAISGVLTIIIWLSLIAPYMIANNYGGLLGVLTTEATYAIDLGVLCPGMIICAILISRKNDIGYKTAPIFLYILFGVGPMVILQSVYCSKLGLDIPVPSLIGTVLSFVVMCTFAIVFLCKSLNFFEKA